MTRGLLALAAAAFALALFAPSSFASTCTLEKVDTSHPGNSLFDSGGYEFDTTPTPTNNQRDLAFATLEDGGSNPPDGTPPGPVDNGDSWDHWGALFVGGEGLTNLYSSTDDNSCTLEDGGHQLAFPVLSIGGLDVQRKLFVSPTGLDGGRLLELVHNPGISPVTTSVQVGDTQAADDGDDLGSDNVTVVSFSSDGNSSIDNDDLWVVTSDHLSGTLSDDALAHVFDGIGGAEHVDFATLTGTDADPKDNLAYRWDDVNIPPGGTAAYLSYEIQAADSTKDAVTDTGLARDQALGYEALPLAQIYSGMSDAEITAVRNWPHPQPTAAIAAVTGASDAAPVTLSSAGSQPSNAAGVCQGASFAWNLGDGTTAASPTVTHQFAAGSHTVTLTAANSCGSTATATQTFTVAHAGTAAPTVSAALATRIKFSRLAAGKLVLTLTSSENSTASIAGTVSRSVAKRATVAKISRTVIKKKATLTAGKRTKVHLKLSKKARKGLAHLHRGFTLSISVTTRDAAGNKRVTHKHVKVTF